MNFILNIIATFRCLRLLLTGQISLKKMGEEKMDKEKLFSFFRFLEIPFEDTSLGAMVKKAEFDHTELVLISMAKRIGLNPDTLKDMYTKYKIKFEFAQFDKNMEPIDPIVMSRYKISPNWGFELTLSTLLIRTPAVYFFTSRSNPLELAPNELGRFYIVTHAIKDCLNFITISNDDDGLIVSSKCEISLEAMCELNSTYHVHRFKDEILGLDTWLRYSGFTEFIN